MDRFTELETFVAVADHGGFNAAARALNRSAPTITRLVSGLEERIGTRLFTRTTRQIALTEAGARLYGDARRILEDLAAAEASAAGAHEAPQGTLSVTAPVIFGQRYIAPILRDFLDANPRVTARALFVDRIVHMIEEGLDVAVRIGELPDSSLTAIRVGQVRQVVVAAPAYLEAHGIPETPEALGAHRLAVPQMESRAATWRFVSEAGTREIALDPRLAVSGLGPCIDAARAGWAVTRALSYQVADELASGRLVEILKGFETRRVPVHLVHAEGRLGAAKIRAFLDLAAERLRAETAAWGA